MSISYNPVGRGADPIDHLIAAGDGVTMAIVTKTEGPHYRPVGAVMALGPDDTRVGTLSSGCIEADLLLHARRAQKDNAPVTLRYGHGSPFMDIVLPCGGGLEIFLVPRPNIAALQTLRRHRAARETCAMDIDPKTGALTVHTDQSAPKSGNFRAEFEPEIRFLVFGKGPEAATFAALANSVGYPVVVISPDPETQDEAASSGCDVQRISRPEFPANLNVDSWTAVLAFFHDHEWEPPILLDALASAAFYVGAQGSRRSASERINALTLLGATAQQIERLKGPIGLVPSARDARTLAVSVLAEVLNEARAARAA